MITTMSNVADQAKNAASFIAKMRQEHKHAIELSEAIAAFLRKSCDPAPLREWFTANRVFAEYELLSCFSGIRFSQLEELPDAASYPMFIGVYLNMMRRINDPVTLQLIDCPPLPAIKSLRPQ